MSGDQPVPPVTLSQLRAACDAYHRSTGDADEGRSPRSDVEERYLALLNLAARAGLDDPPGPELAWHDLFRELRRWWTKAEARLGRQPDPGGAARAPDYLGLIVDETHGEVRRPGQVDRFGNPKVVCFRPDSAEWHTFLVAFRAGERGATDAEWERGYSQTDADWSARRRTKGRVAEKLRSLDVEFEGGSLRLVALPAPGP
jgi:hypothetical protein